LEKAALPEPPFLLVKTGQKILANAGHADDFGPF
jgi:hypothetical protein